MEQQHAGKQEKIEQLQAETKKLSEVIVETRKLTLSPNNVNKINHNHVKYVNK